MGLMEVKCPLCKGSLWIDPSTMKVVDHKPAGEGKADFEKFLEDSKKPKGWDDKMKRAKEEEERRKAEIEQKFRMAKDDVGGDAPPAGMAPRSNLDWD